MQQPIPADINKLKNLLSGAKQVMRKVETGDYSTGNVSLNEGVTGDQLVDGSNINQSAMGGVNTNNVAPKMMGNQPVYKNINESKMPDAIKNAMISNPIPQLSGPNHTFTLDDVQDLVEKPMPTNYRPSTQQNTVNESVNQGGNTFNVSEGTLRAIVKEMINEALLDFMSESYAKNLTENTIKKTINTLIKEGKIRTKKKVNS